MIMMSQLVNDYIDQPKQLHEKQFQFVMNANRSPSVMSNQSDFHCHDKICFAMQCLLLAILQFNIQIYWQAIACMHAPPQEIQMRQSKLMESDRAMLKNRLVDRGHNNYNSNESSSSSKTIFGADFEVEDMRDPIKYLPNYNQNIQQDNCMATCQNCCGDLLLALSCVFPICCAKCCVYELQTSSVGLVQSFGKFSRLLKPGFNRINPCSQEVHEVDMRIRIMGTGRNVAITKDNVKVTVETSVAFRITNPIIIFYRMGNQLNKAVIELVISSFRKAIGLQILQEVLTDRQKIVADVINQVKDNMVSGIFIQNVFMDDIVLPHDVERDLSSVARQKRISQATIIDSKADVESAQLMKESAELLDTKAAMQIRYLQMVQDLGRRGATLLMDIGIEKKGAVSYHKQKQEDQHIQ